MILVTGGAGYIGSHVAKELVGSGQDVVILDNLTTGHRETVEEIKKLAEGMDKAGSLELVVGDTGDRAKVTEVLRNYAVEAVVHLAASSQVGESMLNPGKYFDNNVSRAVNLLECMQECRVKRIVFSSTAAVYGEPLEVPITEDHPVQPTNVYGESKLMVEKMLAWYDRIYGIKYVSLRYFNAAGADSSGELGEWHEPETHLIPIVMQKVLGQRASLTVFGEDYPTPDGTCIRDYIHVTDLAQAHILALEALGKGMDSRIYNMGNGNGYSVKEVIRTVTEAVEQDIPYTIGARRVGDPAVLVASSQRIRAELGWQPVYPKLKSIVNSAWKWHNRG